MEYVCSLCGQEAYYDGRCGDGPILMCGCDKGQWIDDGRGGYYSNPYNAKPILGTPRKNETVALEEQIQQLTKEIEELKENKK